MNSQIKKEVIFGIVSSLLVLVFIVVYIASYKGTSNKIQGSQQTSSVSETVLTEIEIAKHNTETDCWLVVDNKVYDVTPYAVSHPGGTETIFPYCGKDATKEYRTKGDKGQPHSDSADKELGTLYIGDVNGTKKK